MGVDVQAGSVDKALNLLRENGFELLVRFEYLGSSYAVIAREGVIGMALLVPDDVVVH